MQSLIIIVHDSISIQLLECWAHIKEEEGNASQDCWDEPSDEDDQMYPLVGHHSAVGQAPCDVQVSGTREGAK